MSIVSKPNHRQMPTRFGAYRYMYMILFIMFIVLQATDVYEADSSLPKHVHICTSQIYHVNIMHNAAILYRINMNSYQNER